MCRFASLVAFALPPALLACAPAPPPAAPPEAAPAATAPPAPSPAAPEPSAPPPSARVVDVVPAKDDTRGVRAKIIFENPGRSACRVLGYKLSWAGKSKAITLQDLTLPPGETRERWLKVSPDDGDIAALTPSSGQIDAKIDCGR
jgi:hypothetical protein